MKRFINATNFIYFLLILFGTFVFFKPPTDPDFGWHYKYGEYFVQHGIILRDNIFSYTNTNYKWVNSYWVAEVIMYLSHHFLGSVVSTLILSSIFGAFLLTILKKQSKNLVNLSINYIAISAILSVYTLTVRPLYYSTIFMFLLVYILIFKKHWAKFLPFIFLIWANTHADFVMALFIYGVFCLNNWVSKIIQMKGSNSLRVLAESFLDSFKIFFICLLSTLINPYGIKLWVILANELTQPIKSFVGEWNPFDFNLLDSTTLFISFLMAIGLISSFAISKRKKHQFGWWYKALIIIFYILTIKAAYFGRIFVILSSFAIVQELEILIGDISLFLKKKGVYFPKISLVFFLVFISFTTFPLFLDNVSLATDVSRWSVQSGYPYNALVYVKKNPIAGNMLNVYNWGGYLIWQFSEYKTFIDGRMAAWNENGNFFMKDYLQMYHEPQKNSELLNKYVSDYNITWVLDRPKSDLVKYLLEKGAPNAQWKTVYEDNIAVIIQKQ